jgi:hypothetical protein
MNKKIHNVKKISNQNRKSIKDEKLRRIEIFIWKNIHHSKRKKDPLNKGS